MIVTISQFFYQFSSGYQFNIRKTCYFYLR